MHGGGHHDARDTIGYRQSVIATAEGGDRPGLIPPGPAGPEVPLDRWGVLRHLIGREEAPLRKIQAGAGLPAGRRKGRRTAVIQIPKRFKKQRQPALLFLRLRGNGRHGMLNAKF